MKSTDAPSKQAVPFGTNGPREAITPTTPSGSNQASYDQGFPPITMTLKSAGGLPPKGQDMNQILFEQSSFNRYFAAGGGYVYDSTFSTAVGGYPLSARVPNSTGTGFWFNTVEDNQTNPENSTSALTGWVPMGSYGVTAITGLTSASVTLTTLQASKDRITLAGTLTANINIVVPAWIKRWEIINNCVGAFSVTIKTPSGTGASVKNGSTANVFGDGVNITNTFSPGSLINIQVFNSTGTYTKTPGAKFGIARALGAGGAGGGTKVTSSSQVSAGWGGDAGTYGESSLIDLTSVNTVQVTVGAGGAPVSGGNGNSGGDSSFGGYIAVSGGTGGAFGEAGGTQSIGSDNSGGGTASGSALAFFSSGQSGSGPTCVTTSGPGIKSGRGGDSAFGGGGGAVNGVTTTARPAAGKGGGGSGAAVGIGSTNTVSGGRGGDGIVIVMEYA